MMRAIHRYLNALFVGFIVTFIIYLLWVLDQSELWRGVAIAVAGGAVVLGVYIYLDRRFGSEPDLYDRGQPCGPEREDFEGKVRAVAAGRCGRPFQALARVWHQG